MRSMRPLPRRAVPALSSLRRTCLPGMLLLAACSGAPADPLPADPPDGGAATDGPPPDLAGTSCAPGPVPAAVRAAFGLSPFYVKYLDYRGLPILSSGKTSDRALCAARDTIAQMLSQRPELVGRLVERKIRLAIMARTELTTDIPEHSDLMPKDYWDQRARGLGATLARPAVSGAEENVLCDRDDRYVGESILVHEFSHAVFNIAIDLYEPALKARLDQAYAAAIAAGRFKDTYAATNRDEYWAEGAQDWFDTNLKAVPANGIHNEIHTRALLEAYDSPLAAVAAEVFGRGPWRYACP